MYACMCLLIIWTVSRQTCLIQRDMHHATACLSCQCPFNAWSTPQSLMHQLSIVCISDLQLRIILHCMVQRNYADFHAQGAQSCHGHHELPGHRTWPARRLLSPGATHSPVCCSFWMPLHHMLSLIVAWCAWAMGTVFTGPCMRSWCHSMHGVIQNVMLHAPARWLVRVPSLRQTQCGVESWQAFWFVSAANWNRQYKSATWYRQDRAAAHAAVWHLSQCCKCKTAVLSIVMFLCPCHVFKFPTTTSGCVCFHHDDHAWLLFLVLIIAKSQ